jgi:2-iminobutanoate/2-iminopropanoate deaminase
MLRPAVRTLVALLAAPLAQAAAQAPAQPAAAPGAAKFHAGATTSPLSSIVEVGNTIYLAGMLGTGADGQLAAGGIEAETKQSMENIRAALARVGATMDDVVKCTVFLADMAERDKMNAVYTTYFPKHKPARSAVGVNGLARDARVEVECLAVRGAGL